MVSPANPISSEELERWLATYNGDGHIEDRAAALFQVKSRVTILASELLSLRKERDDLREQLARRDVKVIRLYDKDGAEITSDRLSAMMGEYLAALQPSGEAQ